MLVQELAKENLEGLDADPSFIQLFPGKSLEEAFFLSMTLVNGHASFDLLG